MSPFIIHPPLYLITDRHQTRGGNLSHTIQAALSAGVKIIQLREKDLPTRDLLSLARVLRELSLNASAKLLINGRIDICLAVQADGVHLPSNGLPTYIARKVLGRAKLIGVSTHSIEEALRAQDEGADFVTLGPIYETPSKGLYGKPLGLPTLRAVRSQLKLPIFALGGIKKGRVQEVLRAGADGIALISAILRAEDPRQATLDILAELRPR